MILVKLEVEEKWANSKTVYVLWIVNIQLI